MINHDVFSPCLELQLIHFFTGYGFFTYEIEKRD